MNMMFEHENQKLKTRIAELEAEVARLREVLARIVRLDLEAEENPRVTWQETWDIARAALDGEP